MNDIQTPTDPTETPITAVTAGEQPMLEAPADDEVEARLTSLRSQLRGVAEKTRTFANELWSDLQGVGKTGSELTKAVALRLRRRWSPSAS